MVGLGYCVLLLLVCVVYANQDVGSLKTVQFQNPPLLGRTASVNPKNSDQVVESLDVFFGSISGLVFEGFTTDGAHVFLAHSDRGPTGNIQDIVSVAGKTKKQNGRAFVLPDFVPKLFRIHVNFNTEHIEIVDIINLTKADGITPLSGLPNLQFGQKDFAFTDAYPVDLFGNQLPNDPLGADLEGIAIAADGTYWFGDEYRPSLYHFDKQGRLLDRLIPRGIPTESGQYGTPVLPEVYALRQENRGFEAVAIEEDLLYAFLQSPLDNPNAKDNSNGLASRNIRILVFNTTSYLVHAEYVYVLGQKQKVDKISDATSLGNGRFLVVERDASAGKKAFKNIIEVDVNGATDISIKKTQDGIPVGNTLEQVAVSSTDIVPVTKSLIVNLATIGWKADNVEGITIIDPTTFVVVNDNDYQLNQAIEPVGNGYIEFDRKELTTFGLVSNFKFGDNKAKQSAATPSARVSNDKGKKHKSPKRYKNNEL